MSEKDTAIGRMEREIGDLNDELDLEIENRQKSDEKCEQLKEEVCVNNKNIVICLFIVEKSNFYLLRRILSCSYNKDCLTYKQNIQTRET